MKIILFNFKAFRPYSKIFRLAPQKRTIVESSVLLETTVGYGGR